MSLVVTAGGVRSGVASGTRRPQVAAAAVAHQAPQLHHRQYGRASRPWTRQVGGRGGGGDGMSIRDEATVGLRCVPEKGKGPSYVHARRIRAGER